MTKLSKRLHSLALFVNNQDCLADIGCDHGYLSIYLKENNLVKYIIASDINQNALNSAISNINKRNLDIPTILSDGLNNIDTTNLNTLLISGMGTNTILHILNNKNKLKPIKKLIIQSNNDYELLRKELNNLGYYLEKEQYTYDKGKWYLTTLFIKSKKKNTLNEIKYGYLNNPEYNQYLIKQEYEILKKIPFTKLKIKIQKYLNIKHIQKAISKKK